MDAATSRIRPEREAAHSRRLRAKIRAVKHWSIALGLHFVVVRPPIAANYGKSLRPRGKPSPEWAPRVIALGITGPCAGAAASVLAILSMKWKGQRPRKVRR